MINPPVKPTAWSRLFARLIDVFVFGGFGLVGFLTLLLSQSPKQYILVVEFLARYELFLAVPLILFSLVVEVVLLTLFSTTLGKFLFGIRVLSHHGFSHTAKRTLLLWIYGLGLGLPFLGQLAPWLQFRRLRRQGQTSYDEKTGFLLEQRNMGPFRYAVLVASFLGFLGLVIAYGFYLNHAHSGGEFVATEAGFKAHFPTRPQKTMTEFYQGDLQVKVTQYSAKVSLYEEYTISVRDYSKKIPEDRFQSLAKVMLEQRMDSGDWIKISEKFDEQAVFPVYEFKLHNQNLGVFQEGRYLLGRPHSVFLISASYSTKNRVEAFFQSFGLLR